MRTAGATVAAAVATGALAAVLGGCAAPASQFREDAEAFVRSDEVFETYGVDFTDPECEEPASTAEGTTITCSAAGGDNRYVFTLRIVGDREMVLDAVTPIYAAGSIPSDPVDSTGPADAGESTGPTAPTTPSIPATLAASSTGPPTPTTVAASSTGPTTSTTIPAG